MAQVDNLVLKKNAVIEAQVKTIVSTVLKNCEQESKCNCLCMPLDDYDDRAAFYTGLSKYSLYKLLEKTESETLEQTYDVVQRVVIMKALLRFYKQRHLVNFKDLFIAVKEVFPAANIVDFRRILTAMGFDYRKTLTGPMIVEDAALTFERYHYLKKIKKLRSNKTHICYLEERYIDKKFTFNKPDFENDACFGENDATHIWDGFYLYHILSDTGLEHYFVTNKISAEEYQKWIDVTVKFLAPDCAIVIDDHPLHGELVDDTITHYHSKVDMLNWLRKHNIPCNDSMCKPELYDLISRCNKPNRTYDFDNLLKVYGHEVLRLPNEHKLLSPTPALWTEVRNIMCQMNKEFSLVELEAAVITSIRMAHTSTWKKIKQKVIFCEGVLDTLHSETEAALENYAQFDVKNINKHANIPEYFYNLDTY